MIYDWTLEFKGILNELRPGALLGLYRCPWNDDAYNGARRRILGLDYDLLKEKLIELKKVINNKGYVDKETAIITAGADIEYQVIVTVMDVILKYEDDEGNIQPLVPRVNCGQGR